jgi:hypothetical protein
VRFQVLVIRAGAITIHGMQFSFARFGTGMRKDVKIP